MIIFLNGLRNLQPHPKQLVHMRGFNQLECIVRGDPNNIFYLGAHPRFFSKARYEKQ